MRQYVLTDRDFEDFYAIMVAVEAQIRVEYNLYKERGEREKKPNWEVADNTLRSMRYHFIGWRNRMMSGDTSSRDSEYVKEPEWLKTRLKQLGLLEEEK